MSASGQEPGRPHPSRSLTDAQKEFTRLEDAHRDAMECAAVLAKHFEYQAAHHQEDNVAMFAAMGFEGLARTIVKQLDVMLCAAAEMRDARVDTDD